MSFKKGEKVKHVKSGGIYGIVDEPSEMKRLEHCDEPFYVYRCLTTYIDWHRCRSEMEDGRFVKVED